MCLAGGGLACTSIFSCALEVTIRISILGLIPPGQSRQVSGGSPKARKVFVAGYILYGFVFTQDSMTFSNFVLKAASLSFVQVEVSESFQTNLTVETNVRSVFVRIVSATALVQNLRRRPLGSVAV